MRNVRRLAVGAVLLAAGPSVAVAQPETAPCPVPIQSTFTKPPYPNGAAQDHEEGTVLALIFLRATGAPAHVDLLESSGFPDLDEAALAWIKDHWMWQPPQNGCTEVRVAYHWSLGSPSRTSTKKSDPGSMTEVLMDYPPKTAH